MQRGCIQGRFSTMLDNFSTMHCDVTLPGEYGGRHLLEACPRHVSVHALLAECDNDRYGGCGPSEGFNPRTPCGVRRWKTCRAHRNRRFQSTHSLWSATYLRQPAPNEHPVSIHALLVECDRFSSGQHPRLTSFNPRTPCGVRLRPTLYIATQQSKSYFAPTSLKRPSLHGCSF